MNWSTPRELKEQLGRLWDKGDLLRAQAGGEPGFPLRLAFKGPDSGAITERFEAVRAWTRELAGLAHIRIEWRTVRHRVQGEQSLPASIWIDTLDQALGWLGKRREAQVYARLFSSTSSSHPALLPWLLKRPHQALSLADDWPRLLAVVSWLSAHPRPGVYLRQVDLAGVHSKFIEAQRAVLAELLELALPPAAIDATKTGTGQFAARFGFLDKPLRIRLRLLDPDLVLLPGTRCPDLTVDAASFSQLNLDGFQVFITENETNFLAFPHAAKAIAIFGAGYGWEALSRAHWLHNCAMHYWGDIDTHGFGILDQLRSHFPHVQSFLMDRATLLAHQVLWGDENQPLQASLMRLTLEERQLYDDLRDNRLGKNLRLEQERIGFGWVSAHLQPLRQPTA